MFLWVKTKPSTFPSSQRAENSANFLMKTVNLVLSRSLDIILVPRLKNVILRGEKTKFMNAIKRKHFTRSNNTRK